MCVCVCLCIAPYNVRRGTLLNGYTHDHPVRAHLHYLRSVIFVLIDPFAFTVEINAYLRSSFHLYKLFYSHDLVRIESDVLSFDFFLRNVNPSLSRSKFYTLLQEKIYHFSELTPLNLNLFAPRKIMRCQNITVRTVENSRTEQK